MTNSELSGFLRRVHLQGIFKDPVRVQIKNGQIKIHAYTTLKTFLVNVRLDHSGIVGEHEFGVDLNRLLKLIGDTDEELQITFAKQGLNIKRGGKLRIHFNTVPVNKLPNMQLIKRFPVADVSIALDNEFLNWLGKVSNALPDTEVISFLSLKDTGCVAELSDKRGNKIRYKALKVLGKNKLKIPMYFDLCTLVRIFEANRDIFTSITGLRISGKGLLSLEVVAGNSVVRYYLCETAI